MFLKNNHSKKSGGAFVFRRFLIKRGDKEKDTSSFPVKRDHLATAFVCWSPCRGQLLIDGLHEPSHSIYHQSCTEQFCCFCEDSQSNHLIYPEQLWLLYHPLPGSLYSTHIPVGKRWLLAPFCRFAEKLCLKPGRNFASPSPTRIRTFHCSPQFFLHDWYHRSSWHPIPSHGYSLESSMLLVKPPGKLFNFKSMHI